ncbi:MAG: cas6 [Gemmataceae bacterium]|nr:cas6 [Gemmataceae bacterium]
MLDLLFPVFGGAIPTDHAYPLYAALARLVPAFHDPATGLRFTPIGGVPDTPGQLRLADHSRLRVRLPEERIRVALPLAGKKLEVAGHAVRVGVPSVTTLTPAPMLAARVVTFKHADDPARFLATARLKLAELGVEGEPAVPLITTGPRAGEPRRRVVRVKGKAIVGYTLLVSGLTAEHSIRLQEQGLGGRTRMGCGFFLPHLPRVS